MRLFVGVELSDDVRTLAAGVAGELRRTLGKALEAKWVVPANMHLTVRFIGYVADDSVSTLLGALRQPLTMPTFEIEFGGCGRFPPRGAPRVLWIGLTRGLESLATLHREFNQRLTPFGYEPENRPFSAHLTLARIKDARSAAAHSVDRAFESIRAATMTMRVETVTIFESRLSSAGATYFPMHRIALRS
jgi:2'-5' RNA ligase